MSDLHFDSVRQRTLSSVSLEALTLASRALLMDVVQGMKVDAVYWSEPDEFGVRRMLPKGLQ